MILLPEKVRPKFLFGEGMGDVLRKENIELLLNTAKNEGEREEDAAISINTMILAKEGTQIKGEDLYNIIQQAKKKRVTIASLASQIPNTDVNVEISPGPGVVDHSERSGRKKNAD
jgi:hypothetical protein